MLRLAEAGLPGRDFVLTATNAAMTQWVKRVASTGDVQRNYQVMLMEHLDFAAEEAVLCTIHGFRHTLVCAGAQLRQQGHVNTEGMEALGHWNPGSSMPRRYDNAAGVTELATRATITEALARGWAPAAEEELPMAYRPVNKDAASGSGTRNRKRPRDEMLVPEEIYKERVAVRNTTSGKLHWTCGTGLSLCAWWKCGTAEEPASIAEFLATKEEQKIWTGEQWCKLCAKAAARPGA